MNKQNPLDVSLFVLGILLAVGSITSWIQIGIISVAGTSTWWGFATLVSALSIIGFASVRLWPQILDESISKHMRNIAIIGSLLAIGIVGYVGIRLTDASRQFDKSMDQSQLSESDTSALGQDFQDSIDEFTKSLAEAFHPSLAFGWYMSAGSSIGGLVLILKKHEDAKVEIPTYDPPSA